MTDPTTPDGGPRTARPSTLATSADPDGPTRRLADVPPSGPAASRPIAAPPLGHRERRTRNVGWRSRDVIRAAVLVMGLYVLGQLLWFANSLVFVVFLAVLFGLAVGSAVDRLERFHIRRGIASALVVFGTLGILITTGALMAPTLTAQFAVLRGQIPESIDRAETWVNSHQGGLLGTLLKNVASPTTATPGTPGAPTTAQPAAGQPAAGSPTAQPTTPATGPRPQTGAAPTATATLKDRLGTQLSGITKYLFPFLSSTLTVVGGLFLIIFLAIYIGAEPKTYHDGLMHLFPHRARKRAGEVLSEMAVVLRKWLVVQLIAMAVIGGVTTVAMLALGVKAAYALGFIAGLLEFVPTVGPILSAVPAIAMAFVDGPEKALLVVFAYWGIQFLENNLLIPRLMSTGLEMPPALTLVAQALMTLVFGFLGLMVAVPLTAAILVPIKMLYVRDIVGDDMPLMSNGEEDDGDDDDD